MGFVDRPKPDHIIIEEMLDDIRRLQARGLTLVEKHGIQQFLPQGWVSQGLADGIYIYDAGIVRFRGILDWQTPSPKTEADVTLFNTPGGYYDLRFATSVVIAPVPAVSGYGSGAYMPYEWSPRGNLSFYGIARHGSVEQRIAVLLDPVVSGSVGLGIRMDLLFDSQTTYVIRDVNSDGTLTASGSPNGLARTGNSFQFLGKVPYGTELLVDLVWIADPDSDILWDTGREQEINP